MEAFFKSYKQARLESLGQVLYTVSQGYAVLVRKHRHWMN